MRSLRLLAPLTLIFAVGSAAPATAADFDVAVPDFGFEPPRQQVAVGDRVTWTFSDDVMHSTRALRGQADSWNSGLKAMDATFSRVFTKPGRFDYICEPHPFMEGRITVGRDAETDTVDNFRSVRRGNDVTIKFTLNEAAKATYKLTKGASRRTVGGRRLRAGRHSFRLRNLRVGQYQGTLTLVDDFAKKVTPKNFFVIR